MADEKDSPKEEEPKEEPKEETPEDIIEETEQVISQATPTKEGSPINLPEGSKFILLFQAPNQPLSIQTGGFIDLDQMLGFARRTIDPQMVERMIIAGVQQISEQQAPPPRR